MPSHPPSTDCDYGPVYPLRESDVLNDCSPTLQPAQISVDTPLKDGGLRLGNFAAMFKTLGISDTASLPPLDPESEFSNSDDALLPSPTFELVQAPPVKHVEDTEDQPKNKKQRQKARKRAERVLEEEQNRLRVIQETLDQISREHQQIDHVEQRLSLRQQLEDLADTAAAPETASRPSRSHSRFNVGSKMRPTTPNAVAAISEPEAPRTQQKKPKTPKRPGILKQPSVPQLATPVQRAPNVIPSTDPVPPHVQYTTFETPAPQYFLAPQYELQSHNAQPVTPVGQHGLVPRTVRPVTMPRTASQPAAFAQPPTTPTPHTATPMGRSTLTIRPRLERHVHLHNKLWDAFPEDRKYVVDPMQLLRDRASTDGLHVFVDASNIMIGLKDKLRSHGLHHNAFDLSFASLALVMERRRPIAKRFSAGSHREANPLPHVSKLVETSKDIGYDTVMQEQVLIVREDSEKRKFFNDVKKMGWFKANQLRTGSGSDSETGAAPTPKTASAPKWVEQGVDEILHLKMCQSILDTEVPSTMVLATGDGAVAEMSDGFLAHVERALKKGWKVELVSWGQQINGGYKKKKFRAKWADQFTIIELDEFLEDLIDTPDGVGTC
jgi:hypothetical protein